MEQRITLYQDDNEIDVETAYHYLMDQNITSCEVSSDTEDNKFSITVLEDEFESAKSILLKYFNETSENENEFIEDEVSDYPTKAYVGSKTKYEDMSSSAYVLTGFGIIGLLLLILEFSGILHILPVQGSTKWLFYITMATMFIIFLVIGIKSFSASKGLKLAAQEEETKTAQINDWVSQNLSPEMIDQSYEEGLQENDLYLARYAYIKARLNSEFPGVDSSFIEELIEQIYVRFYE